MYRSEHGWCGVRVFRTGHLFPANRGMIAYALHVSIARVRLVDHLRAGGGVRVRMGRWLGARTSVGHRLCGSRTGAQDARARESGQTVTTRASQSRSRDGGLKKSGFNVQTFLASSGVAKTTARYVRGAAIYKQGDTLSLIHI